MNDRLQGRGSFPVLEGWGKSTKERQKMEYVNPLGEEKVSVLVRKFSVPAIIGMLVNALYNIIDRIFIGNSADLGENGLAGITVAFPLMICTIAIGVLFGIGGATYFSMKLGNKKQEEAEHALGNAFVMLLIAGTLYCILGEIFLDPLLVLFGASQEVLPFAKEFMQIIFVGSIFQVCGMGLNNFMRADGNPKLAMITMFFGAGLNILLDPIFIFGLHMGMRGAGLATSISQFLSFLWVLSYFLGKKSHCKLRCRYLKLDRAVVGKIFMLGSPNFFLQLAASLLNAILNRGLISYGGDLAVSSMGIVNSIQTLLLMPVIGLNQGIQPIISFNFGAKKYERVKEAVLVGIKLATAIVIVGYLVTRLFPVQLIQIFNRDPELVKLGKFCLEAWFFCMPVVGFQIIASNYFQAIGQAKSAMFLTLTRQVIILIPAVILFPRIWGLHGILYAGPFADFVSFLMTAIWFYFGLKRLKQSEEMTDQNIL